MLRVVLPALSPESSLDSASDDSSVEEYSAADDSAFELSAGASLPSLELPQAVIEARSATAESTDNTFFILITSININLVCSASLILYEG